MSNGVVGVMTGPWLIVKWAGIGILLFYCALIMYAARKSRIEPARMRACFLPMLLGNLVAFTLPWIFMAEQVTRICFLAAVGIYIYGVGVLLKNLGARSAGGSLRLTADR